MVLVLPAIRDLLQAAALRRARGAKLLRLAFVRAAVVF